MRALVLSAGYGERLRPLTEKIPKPLLEAGGRPLIHYPLLMLRHAGIVDVAINVHHLGAQIEHALGRGEALGLRITYSPEPALLGTGGPLLALRDYFGKEPFVMLNCDTILGLDLPRMIAFHRERAPLATFALRDGGDPDAYSRIEIDADGRIRRMRLLRGRSRGEFDDYPAELAPEIAAALKPYMYCGAMVCEPAVLEMLPKNPPFSLMGGLFAPIAAQGLPLCGYVDRSFFRTVDDLASYEALRAEFAASPPPLAYLPR
ncbi:MAG TPA: NDP-sugar synthase [Candidatus Binataceae bacterium]|nr:NDP-sugar synthase [Candidatus Binataceae bacterium]